jgi:aldehyde dehydrogenase (NAD+)
MREVLQFYIDGAWVDPVEPRTRGVGRSGRAAHSRRDQPGYGGSLRTHQPRLDGGRRQGRHCGQAGLRKLLDLLQAILDEFTKRYKDVAEAIMDEMGAPWDVANGPQAGSGPQHIKATIRALKAYEFEERNRDTLIVREPIGVCGMITPWNWPVNQVACKVAPALAAGCTMVLKPSEIAPFDAAIFAEIVDAAGVPAGVFNLVNGDGPGVGTALSEHPGIDMVSFTGSTRAGVLVAQNAAPTVKRVAQELGGKSANILLDDADFETAVKGGAEEIFLRCSLTHARPPGPDGGSGRACGQGRKCNRCWQPPRSGCRSRPAGI